VQLLKSVLCLQGFDNRYRFLTLSVFSYLCFILLKAALPLSFVLILLLGLVTLNALTTLRRLNDAQLNKNWLVGPSLSFLITGLIIIFAEHSSTYWLLFIPLVFSALLLTYPSKFNHSYILGYYGPVDLSEYSHQQLPSSRHSNRIEPSVMGSTTNADMFDQDTAFATQQMSASDINPSDESHVNINSPQAHDNAATNKQDIGEIIRLTLFSHKNARITLIAVFTLILSAVVISMILSSFNNAATVTTKEVTTKIPPVRLSPVELPDNFSLMLSQYQGLIIHWQANNNNETTLWKISSATGDKTCQAISFNKGDEFRTTEVVVEQKNKYYASFSPLDTKALIQAIAFRGSFSLCGYTFSLKGSQAALGKHLDYAELVEY
jgi:hypothetical protein